GIDRRQQIAALDLDCTERWTTVIGVVVMPTNNAAGYDEEKTENDDVFHCLNSRLPALTWIPCFRLRAAFPKKRQGLAILRFRSHFLAWRQVHGLAISRCWPRRLPSKQLPG